MAQRDSHDSDGRIGLAGSAPDESGSRLPHGRVTSGAASDASRDTVEEFAQDLRQLRHANNFPKLTTMQSHTGISKSTISAALKGDRLPSEKTVRALASLFGADTEEWLRRRRALDRRTPAARTEPEVGFNPETGLLETPSIADASDRFSGQAGAWSEARVPMVSRRLLFVTTVSVAVLSACATTAVWFALSTTPRDASASTN